MLSFLCGLFIYFIPAYDTYYDTLLCTSIGLGFRPMPPESNVESTLIWYRAADDNNYKYWTDELDKFLEGESYNSMLL